LYQKSPFHPTEYNKVSINSNLTNQNDIQQNLNIKFPTLIKASTYLKYPFSYSDEKLNINHYSYLESNSTKKSNV
jgi:hypothetical protein